MIKLSWLSSTHRYISLIMVIIYPQIYFINFPEKIDLKCFWNGSLKWIAYTQETGRPTTLNPLSPHDALKHHFTCLKTDLIFRQTKDFCTTSNHLHPLHVENCDSSSRLVVDEDDKGKFRLERVKHEI